MPDKKKLYIRPGHGHDDPGATALDGKFEKDINLQVSLKLRDKLKDTFEIKMYREDDSRGTGVTPQLQESCNESNDYKPDLVICVHHNSSDTNTASGYQVIIKDDDKSRTCANLIAKEFEALGQNKDSSGINVRDDLYETKHTDAPFVLTEFCYLSNPSDYNKVNSPEAQDKEAGAIASAVSSYFNTTITSTSVSTNNNTGSLGSVNITVVPNTKTNSDYENIDSKSELVNQETGVKPDVYDLVNTPDDPYTELRKIDPNIPKPFSTMWDKGFIMDWALDVLETHEVDTKDYTYERIEGYNTNYYSADKTLITLKKGYTITCSGKLKEDILFLLNQRDITDVIVIDSTKKNFIATSDMIPIGTKEQNNNASYDETKRILDLTAFTKWLDSVPHVKFSNKYDDGFVDVTDKGNDSKYEFLEYSTEDFKIDSFGGGSITGSSSSTSLSSSAIRQKITDRAKEIIALCAVGKAGYQTPPIRNASGNDAGPDSNGILRYDCSFFVEVCYLAAGIKMPAPSGTQWDLCNNGGIISSDFDRLNKEGKPGDLLFNGTNGSEHVAVYDGNGGQYAAHGANGRELNVQISHTDSITGQFMYWGRCKELIEADKISGGSLILTDGLKALIDTNQIDGQVTETTTSMNSNSYKNIIINTAKQYNLDPYLVFGIITIESTGKINSGDDNGWGLMQTGGSNADAECRLSGGDKFDPQKNISSGCLELCNKQKVMKSLTGIDSIVLAIYAYNSGQGNVQNYISSTGCSANQIATDPTTFSTKLESINHVNALYYPSVAYATAKATGLKLLE